MGKSGGKGLLPPTNPKRRTDPTKTHLRDQRTIRRLKMYTSKIQRNEKGEIVKGSVLAASDRVTQSMARIAPDRRWFGNTRVIGQEALQKFREEMGAKFRDPYSVVIKQSKLPLSLLEEPKKEGGIQQLMDFDHTFGDKSTRKRVRIPSTTVTDLAQHAKTKGEGYVDMKDRNLLSNKARKEEVREDKSQNQKLFKKGQSNRIWNELYKVIDSADVILYVLDARDPMGTRSPFLEDYMRREKKFKHFVFVLNKCDLIPLWATARWLQILSQDYPTIAFHASVTHPFGKGNLISLLRQFNRLHNVTHRGSARTKSPISVGIIGYPNVGKSSLINTLRRKAVCKVAPIPGETKVWQYVALTKSIFLIDCPGIVYDREGNNDTQAVLKGVVRVERLGAADKTAVLDTVLSIVKKKDITNTYGIADWADVNDFLEQLARIRGKLLPGGVPDVDTIGRVVLYDWQRGKLPWFNAPSFESNQKFRDAVELPAAKHMKHIEEYSAFNIVDNERLEAGGAEAGSSDSDDEEGEDATPSPSSASPMEEKKEEIAQTTKGGKGRNKVVTKNSKQRKGSKLGSESKEINEEDSNQTILQYQTAVKQEALKEQRRARARKQRTAAAPKTEQATDQLDNLWAQFVSAQ